jgi:tRNA(Ile)-lysidine synthase TilS/MesJ
MELAEYQKIFEKHISENNLLPEKSTAIVLVSGGKDSTAMAYLFKEYSKKRKDLEADFLNVVFPQMVFGNDSKAIARTVKKISEGLNNFTSKTAETHYDELGRTTKPCLLCKQVRRKIIADILKSRKGSRLMIATGHNNLDLLAYFMEFFSIPYKDITGKGIDFKSLKKINFNEEHLEHFSHFFPKLEMSSGVVLIKPMLVFSRMEIEDMFCRIQGLKNPNFTSGCGVAGHLERCPYAKERHKRILFSFLSTLPEDKVRALTSEGTFKQMLKVMKEKVSNYEDALEKVKKTDYEELLF